MTLARIKRTVGRACIVAFLPTVFSLNAAGREVRTINDGWHFAKGDDSTSVKVHLPHSWNADAYETKDYFRGTGTYTRELSIPESFEGKKIYLKFDGAANKSQVFVDGRPVGEHTGAYSAHVTDISGYVSPGTKHVVKVIVDNADREIPPYSADFTFPGGLYRDAWLMAVDPVHFDFENGPECGFKVSTHKEKDSWSVRLTFDIPGLTRTRGYDVRAEVVAPGGKVIAAGKKAAKKDVVEIVLDNLKGVAEWTPETPNLYTVRACLRHDGRTVDEGECLTAFRTFGFDEHGRFLLNGKPCKLRGMCRHQDQRPMSIALSDEQHRRDMRMIKDMGANFVRISHYPQDDAVLEMCDRLGLIAWEEIPVIDYVPDSDAFADNCEAMLRDMIRRHYNHPSIAMWGYMNEILLRMPSEGREETGKRTLALARRLEKVLAEEDSSRMSTMAFHGSDIYHDAGLADITDVKGWNLYQGWYGGHMADFEKFLSRQHREHPSHRLIVSEYGAGSDLRIHSLKPEPFDFSMEYQQEYLEHYLPVIEDSAFVAGASHWNFIDFSSANRAESMPHINNKGLVTNDRRKKDVYYFFKASWSDPDSVPVAHIAVRDWSERTELIDESGSVVRPVKVYTNLPEVELVANGKSLGVKSAVNRTAVFDVPLEPGRNLIELRHGNRVADNAVVILKGLKVRNGRLDPGTDELAINVGAGSYYNSPSSGLDWLPDREYADGGVYGHTGGSRAVSQDIMELTDDGPLFQRCMNGLEEYRVDVVPGRYEIELGFADLSSPSALSAYMLGRNAGTGSMKVTSMDIVINGETVESCFSPAEESGVKTVVKKRYIADVRGDSGIRVKLLANPGCSSSLSAIKIRKI